MKGLRYERLDTLRALAIVWMAAFHFCFDLNYFGLWQPPQLFTRDPFWTTQRSCIVALFLFCAGLGQAVALHGRSGWPLLDRGFWRRWGQVAAGALLVSAGSALMFPRSWIHFGVLHGIAVMLIAARLLAPLRSGLWPLGAVALALPLWLQHPVFDNPWANWVGLVTRKPITEDYVPVLPWLGVMLWGLAAGQVLLQHRPDLLSGPVPAALRPLAVLGRWSLSFYMLHQPLLIGVLMAGRSLGWW